MPKVVYILGDLPVELSDDEFDTAFTEEEIYSLEQGETIEWIDKDGIDHLVKLID